MQDWNTGDTGKVDGKHISRQPGKMYEFKILDMAFSDRGNYMQTKLEITATVEAFGKPVKQIWTHNKPVQSYKLRRKKPDEE